jgi:polysaccharide pyruvyl transferase CsaB
VRRVLIFGYYGFHNTGDEAILAGMLRDLRGEIADFEAIVVSGDPAGTSRDHGVRAVLFTDVPRLIDAARESEAILLGGGGLFHDYWGAEADTALSPEHGSLSFVSAAPLLSALLDKPLMIYAVGVGPLQTETGRRMTRAAFEQAAVATVRDGASRRVLETAGFDAARVVVTADPAFRLESAPPELAAAIWQSEGPGPGRPLLGVALRNWNVGVTSDNWEAGVAAGLDAFLQTHPEARVLFLPFQDTPGDLVDDRLVAERVRSRMALVARSACLSRTPPPLEMAALVARCDGLLAMRLHAVVFALREGVPVVALSYDPKVRCLLEPAGLGDFVLDLASLEASSVSERLARALGDRELLRPRMSAAVAELSRSALQNATLAAALLREPPTRPGVGPDVAWLLGQATLALSRRAFELGEDGMRVRRELGEGIEYLRGEVAVRDRKLERWEKSWLGRVRKAARQARGAAGRATAPGTPLFAVGSRLIPRPLARWLRRVAAPVAQSEGLVALKAEPASGRRFTYAVPMEPAGRYDVVVFSIIDWDFRFQRPQQLAAQFGRHGHRVFYLSTTQFLSPGGPAWDLKRKTERVGELRIRSRRALNVYSGRLEAVDVDALAASFETLAADLAVGDAVCLVQVPFWAPLAERLRDRLGWRVVYDCMDEWTNFPGFGESVLSLEEALVRGTDATVVSADRLMEKWKGIASRLVLARNAMDAEHYRARYRPNEVLGKLRHPVIGYYGALASWVDVPLLAKIADAHPNATIVLAGGQFDVDLSPIATRPNVRLLGQRPYDEMPQLLWNFDACIIPFLVNDITEATNPVKFYEYLYGGKPVVAPALTELLPYAELSYLARGHDEFLSQLARALVEPADDPRRAARRRVAEENDWTHRYETIDAGLAQAHPLVSIVIVTYGGLELTKACMESLLERETWPRLDVIVVDNASSDGTPEYLATVAAGDVRVRCVYNRENRGFAAANNQGIALSRGDVVVLLNNDTVVPPGLMGRLVGHLRRDASFGLLCPTTNFCGNEALVEPDYVAIAGLPSYAARRASEFRGRVFDLGVAAMYCVAARRRVLDEVGPLDEAYGIGMFEDDDFAVRMRAKGYRVACAEDAYVHHVGQGAFRKLSPEAYDLLWKKNRAYFEKKFGVEWKAHVVREGVKAVSPKVGLS